MPGQNHYFSCPDVYTDKYGDYSMAQCVSIFPITIIIIMYKVSRDINFTVFVVNLPSTKLNPQNLIHDEAQAVITTILTNKTARFSHLQNPLIKKQYVYVVLFHQVLFTNKFLNQPQASCRKECAWFP